MRLIDADELKQQFIDKLVRVGLPSEKAEEFAKTAFDAIFKIIDAMPTIEVEPKHAYVIVDEDGNMECSNCGSSNCFDNYCGTCGAKLIGTKREEVDEQ